MQIVHIYRTCLLVVPLLLLLCLSIPLFIALFVPLLAFYMVLDADIATYLASLQPPKAQASNSPVVLITGGSSGIGEVRDSRIPCSGLSHSICAVGCAVGNRGVHSRMCVVCWSCV